MTRGLVADRGGAVVLIGVFVALALTGSLWFLIGIGDAIAFRETVQEATDAATYSSSVVHARSMNFIAAVNLVMIGVTVIYLILAIIADLFSVALITCTTAAFKPCSYGTYGAVPAALTTAQEVAQNSADQYKDGVLKTTIQTGDRIQTITAKAAPWAGSFAAARVTRRYDKDFVGSTLGLSSAPDIDGGGGSSSGSQSSGQSDDERIGLPVKAVPASKLCDRIFASFALGSWVEKNTGQDFARGFQQLGEAVSKAAKEAGTDRYCSGDFWGEDGPKVVIKSAQNGSDYMQVYGFLLGAKLNDKNRSERAVGALASMKQKASLRAPKSNVYLSQAEFFFDCTNTWDSSACNGEDDSALYSPKWKVRLRRMRSPLAGNALAGQAMALLTTGAASVAGQVLGVSDVDGAVQGVMDAARGEVGSILSNQISSFFNAPPITIPPELKSALPKDIGSLPMPGYFH